VHAFNFFVNLYSLQSTVWINLMYTFRCCTAHCTATTQQAKDSGRCTQQKDFIAFPTHVTVLAVYKYYIRKRRDHVHKTAKAKVLKLTVLKATAKCILDCTMSRKTNMTLNFCPYLRQIWRWIFTILSEWTQTEN